MGAASGEEHTNRLLENCKACWWAALAWAPMLCHMTHLQPFIRVHALLHDTRPPKVIFNVKGPALTCDIKTVKAHKA